MTELSMEGVRGFYAWWRIYNREDTPFKEMFLDSVKSYLEKDHYSDQDRVMATLFIEYVEAIS